MVTDFYDALKSRGLQDILRPVIFTPQLFHNYEKVEAFLDEIAFAPDNSILVYGDYDLDGLMFNLITKQLLDSLDCTNYCIFPYWKRTHDLDREAVRFCIQNKIEYFIIGDTASTSLELLQELSAYGIKVLVIDHHVCCYSYDDYPENVTVISSYIENQLQGFSKYAYSAAALAYVVYDLYAKSRSLNFAESSSAYALTSLYSDCMDMSNEFNRAIYYRAKSIEREKLPTFIRHFMNEHQAFNARFIGFWFAPRINALFRGENFELLNRYFFDSSLDSIGRSRCIEVINDYYKSNREMVQQLVDLIDVVEYEHFVIANEQTALDKCPTLLKNPQNYTGLIANKLSERYRKTSIVYALNNNYYKGSVRDLYGRSYLPIFKNFCYAAGHNAAFGIKINLLDLNYFFSRIEKIDTHYSIDTIPNEPIVVKHEFNSPDNTMIEDIALYNEFSGNSIPVAFFSKQLVGAMQEKVTRYYHRYDWGTDYFIQSDYAINFGTKMLIKPIRSGRTKLLYQG